METQTVPIISDSPSSTSRQFGYARVSTDDQDLRLQIDALTQHGIPKTAIFMDKLLGEVSRIRDTRTLSHGRRLPVGTVHRDRLPATEHPNLAIRLAPDTLLLTNAPFLRKFLDLVD